MYHNKDHTVLISDISIAIDTLSDGSEASSVLVVT